MKQNIGLSIKKARKLRNINQEKLAKKIGITTESLSRIETEKINPSIETLTKISKTLGISEVNARVKMNRIKTKLRTILNP